MGVIRETTIWPSPIYLIERTDPLMGGENGVNNLQAQQLACRTAYLKAMFAMGHDDEGRHLLNEMDVASDAGIRESKLDLSERTGSLTSELAAYEGMLDEIRRLLDSVEGVEGTPLHSIYEALMLSWRYGYPRFAWDMFTPEFTLSGNYRDVAVTETVAGDDSIDVADSSEVVIGQTYLLKDEVQGFQQFVTVRSILTESRVVMWEDVQFSSSGTATLSKGAWDIRNHVAVAELGTAYVTGICDILKDYERGVLLISSRDRSLFKVEYRRPDSDTPHVWQKAPEISATWSDERRKWRTRFQVPGGTIVLRITALKEDAEVDHLVVMTDALGVLPSTIRTPEILGDSFKVRRFGAIYGARHTGTEVQLSQDMDFAVGVETVRLPASTDGDPVWNLRPAMMAKREFRTGETLYWRVRYTADDGGTSLWSTGVGQYTHTENPYEDAGAA